jgi:hypothetical protein
MNVAIEKGETFQPSAILYGIYAIPHDRKKYRMQPVGIVSVSFRFPPTLPSKKKGGIFTSELSIFLRKFM